MERVKLESLRTGSTSSVRGCSRGPISAWWILVSFGGTRGACGCSQSTASLPSLIRTNTHTIKPADFQSVLLVQVTCPGLLIKITVLPLRNQPAQRKINKHQQEPRQNHRVNQSPIPTPPLQQIMCAGEWTRSPIGANGPAGEALTQNLQTLNIPREFTPPKSMQREILTQKHATGSKASELGGGERDEGWMKEGLIA